MKTLIVIPVYNENHRAIDTINKVLRNTKNKLIVVDDGSTDDTWNILKKKFGLDNRISLLSHSINLGKGAAMRTGVSMAWKLKAKAVIFIDADGQHNPKHLKKFEEKLNHHKLVFGFRKLGGEMPFVRKWGNIIAKSILRFLYDIKRKEFLCGYLGFQKSVYKQIKWRSTRYGVETEIATKVGKYHLDFTEIEVDTIYIDKYKGVSLFDAIKILLQIPGWYYN